jgi:transcriptional regulator with XRE-family HTH domain
MILGFGKNKKTVKELRKNQGLTAKELAEMTKVDTIDILKIDDLKLGDVPEPLRTKISPVLKGKYMDKIPW